MTSDSARRRRRIATSDSCQLGRDRFATLECMLTDAITSTLDFKAIPAAELQEARTAGLDEAGNRLTPQLVTEGGDPLRCCLRQTRPGDSVLLIAYTPPGTSGAYAERGPVFIHANPCQGYRTPHLYPPELSHRQQVVRAYDHSGQITDGVLASDGDHALQVISELLTRAGVALVHLRNVAWGCYNFAVQLR